MAIEYNLTLAVMAVGQMEFSGNYGGQSATSEQIVRPFEPRQHYTEISNYALDVIMPQLNGNTWKVLCFLIRKTQSRGKDAEHLSYATIKNGTGISSDTTLSKAIKELLDLGYITTGAPTDSGYAREKDEAEAIGIQIHTFAGAINSDEFIKLMRWTSEAIEGRDAAYHDLASDPDLLKTLSETTQREGGPL